jgi:hypothetical protein
VIYVFIYLLAGIVLEAHVFASMKPAELYRVSGQEIVIEVTGWPIILATVVLSLLMHGGNESMDWK